MKLISLSFSVVLIISVVWLWHVPMARATSSCASPANLLPTAQYAENRFGWLTNHGQLQWHAGLDLGPYRRNAPIYAPVDGFVGDIYSDPLILHGGGKSLTVVCLGNSSSVQLNNLQVVTVAFAQTVRRGQLLGYASGRSDGQLSGLLHVQVNENEQPIDPNPPSDRQLACPPFQKLQTVRLSGMTARDCRDTNINNTARLKQIAQNARDIAADLRPTPCYRTPGSLCNADHPIYSLDEQVYSQYEQLDANRKPIPGRGFFWCTWLVIYANQQAGVFIPPILGAKAMRLEFLHHPERYTYERNGQGHSPQVGETIFYDDTLDGVAVGGHVGIIVRVGKTDLETREANTAVSNTLHGRLLNRNGNHVSGTSSLAVVGWGHVK